MIVMYYAFRHVIQILIQISSFILKVTLTQMVHITENMLGKQNSSVLVQQL